jgi:hypothetical protein
MGDGVRKSINTKSVTSHLSGRNGIRETKREESVPVIGKPKGSNSRHSLTMGGQRVLLQ